jgi:hypothetical protein
MFFWHFGVERNLVCEVCFLSPLGNVAALEVANILDAGDEERVKIFRRVEQKRSAWNVSGSIISSIK